MTTHVLKTDPAVFDAVWNGSKTHEVRFNDRDFQVGDELHLVETTKPGPAMEALFTGRMITKTVSHVLSGYGIQDGWVILSFAAERPSHTPAAWILKTGHGTAFRETINGVAPQLASAWKPLFDHPPPAQPGAMPTEEELRCAFERQHAGRNLDRHRLRGTYVAAGIAALWNQHKRTAAWMQQRMATGEHA